MKKTTKEERIDIVNEIIKEIASRGRHFFQNKKDGKVAYLHIMNNKIWYKCEWVSENGITDICFSIPEYRTPKGWFHGGTLLSLVRDFVLYVQTGKYSNHEHGYGGLYCTHWGYEPEDMKPIQEKAIELGYLLPETV